MTEENFIKFVGLKLVFYLISPNLSAEKWWNSVKDQIQTCKFGKIFFSHFKLVFLFQWYMETPKGLWTLQSTFSWIRNSRSLHIEAQFLGQISHFDQTIVQNDNLRHLKVPEQH